ncbi:hypothetical protein B0T18DRAFT_399232 [Schizothecium vesticola]|uniref:Uncharacterized protein n=1 Tax=Schizothecium vesticola TaxID=314040 RepID=A0AA40FAZ0_9PEZI|nr:hypothetical protein B0T18DRAFT_399232 [Schizothecium vesticola]
MRLLNTSTLTLKYFPSDIPKYAILSHRWEEEEVLYDDIRDGVTDKVKALKGYNKVRPSCEVARHKSTTTYGLTRAASKNAPDH